MFCGRINHYNRLAIIAFDMDIVASRNSMLFWLTFFRFCSIPLLFYINLSSLFWSSRAQPATPITTHRPPTRKKISVSYDSSFTPFVIVPPLAESFHYYFVGITYYTLVVLLLNYYYYFTPYYLLLLRSHTLPCAANEHANRSLHTYAFSRPYAGRSTASPFSRCSWTK